MAFKNYREESKSKGWGAEQSFALSIEQLQTGALLRIADAVELVSADYVKLKKRNEFLELQNKSLGKDLEHAYNRIRSYKGQITKLRNK